MSYNYSESSSLVKQQTFYKVFSFNLIEYVVQKLQKYLFMLEIKRRSLERNPIS
jgi:hypothetical protein